ncbi:RNA-binding domain-containing protein, partial [Atractiella rhizophila]
SVVKEINRLNELELASGVSNKGSWHDRYKDSAYIHIGGLHKQLTEGDVITIFSQYGEPVDINMPKTKEPPYTNRGFAWLMYADQRSTVLAVDNLNGAQVLGRTLKVDHTEKYKQLERNEEGKMVERETESRNAAPELFYNPSKGSSCPPFPVPF